MQVRIPKSQSAGATSTKIVTVNIWRAGIATRLRRSHLRCIGFASGSELVRRNRRNETMRVATATMGVSEHAKKPEGRSPSELEIVTAEAMKFRMIANKIARGNCRRQFGPDTNLNTSKAGRGPAMSGGRIAKARNFRVSTEETCPADIRMRSDGRQRPT